MNVVRWVPGCEDGKEVIVSGSVDRSVRIWKESNGEVDFLMNLLMKVFVLSSYFRSYWVSQLHCGTPEITRNRLLRRDCQYLLS